MPSPASTIPCPVCGGLQHEDLLSRHGVPVNVGMLCDTRESARNVPLGDIVLAQCHGCGLVFNRCYAVERVAYRPGYHAELHYSPSIREWMDRVAEDLVDRHQLSGRHIVEIGCGDGYFLQRLCRGGRNIGLGIDPAISDSALQANATSVRFIRDCFRPELLPDDCDFVCCRSLFEAIPDPTGFLGELHQHLGRRQIPLYFEVFHGWQSLQRQDVWDIHYEQCSYFHAPLLADLFRRSGFEVVRCEPDADNDRYLTVEVWSGSNPDGAQPYSNRCERRTEALASLATRYEEEIHRWKGQLGDYERSRLRVAAWGTGGKAISFLTSLQTETVIPYVVDINPHRQDRFVPRGGQKTVAPQFLTDFKPDVVLITNPAYDAEIRRDLQQLGIACQCVSL